MAPKGSYVDEYRKNAVMGASPVGLIVMLYDGALRFMDQAQHAIASRDYFAQNQNLQKAQKIVSELMCCLDMQRGGEVAQNLLSLYTYVFNQLLEANVDDDPERIKRAAAILSQLRESWVEIDRQRQATQPEVAHAA